VKRSAFYAGYSYLQLRLVIEIVIVGED